MSRPATYADLKAELRRQERMIVAVLAVLVAIAVTLGAFA